VDATLDFIPDLHKRRLLDSELTTGEIKACMDDLKVLGRRDFKALLKWRLGIREELGLEVTEKPTEEATETVEVEPIDEEQEIENEVRKMIFLLGFLVTGFNVDKL
jgi:AdoMet-dependent rRNA methyltransferase SPB1